MNQRKPGSPAAPPRLLLVEDNDDYRRAMLRTIERITRHRGWEVVATSSLEEGEKALRGKSVSLVVADYHLPDGLGTSLTRHVSSAGGRVRRVILTADVDRVQHELDESPDELDDVWDKSWDLREIAEHIDAAMARIEFCRYWT